MKYLFSTLIVFICSFISQFEIEAKVVSIDSHDGKYRVIFENIKSNDNKAYWISVAYIGDSNPSFCYFHNVVIKFSDESKIQTLHAQGPGQKCDIYLNEAEVSKLSQRDIKEITFQGVLSDLIVQLKPGSANKFNPQGNSNRPSPSKSQSEINKQKSSTQALTRPTFKFKYLKIQKGLVVNGYPSIQVDAACDIFNGDGKPYHLELCFYDMNGKPIIIDGDISSENGTKYFTSRSVTASGATTLVSTWWKVYKKRLAIPNGAKQIKARVMLINERDLVAVESNECIINLTTNTPDTYNF